MEAEGPPEIQVEAAEAEGDGVEDGEVATTEVAEAKVEDSDEVTGAVSPPSSGVRSGEARNVAMPEEWRKETAELVGQTRKEGLAAVAGELSSGQQKVGVGWLTPASGRAAPSGTKPKESGLAGAVVGAPAVPGLTTECWKKCCSPG